jgi:ribose-phosphate pyrophosphokinase
MAYYAVVGECEFAEELARELQAEFIKMEPTIFPDGEVKTRLNVSSLKRIGDRAALVVVRANRYAPNPNDCILKTILVADTLMRYGVRRKDLLLPYMFYARQDGERLIGESNSLTKIADIYEELGFKNLITVNSHLYGKRKPLQKFFKSIKVYDVSTARLFADYLETKDLKKPFIVGPGSGPEKMVEELSNNLHCEYECIPKTRNPETGRVDMKPPKSDVRDKDIIIYDDIASSGGTTEMAYRLSEASGPRSIFIALAHLWTSQGIKRLGVLGSREIITTNSFVTARVGNPFTELSLVPLVAGKLKEISSGSHIPLRKV